MTQVLMAFFFCFGGIRRSGRDKIKRLTSSNGPEPRRPYSSASKSTEAVSLDASTACPDVFKMYRSYEPPDLKLATKAIHPTKPLGPWIDPLERPPLDPRKGIHSLPLELVRLIIIHLIYDPAQPGSFRKYWLLPLASTSKGFRALSTEFLFWSMDLFEASFGLRHRVLQSDTIIALFYDLICPGVPSFIRTGVRRLLIRDRDSTALRAKLGEVHLSSILNWVESVRSVHFDGRFYYHPDPSAVLDLPMDSRLSETLVNLTFLNCDPRSPLFPCFLTPHRWGNLTRMEYSDLSDQHLYFSTLAHPSPFACFESPTEPIFPHLSIFCFTHGYQLPESFNQILAFIKLHCTTLDRLSIISRIGGDFNFNLTMDPNVSTRTQLQQECMRALWKCLPNLHRLRLLELDVSVTHSNYAPTHMVRLPSLRALNLHNESAWQHLQSYAQGTSTIHPVTSFYNHIPATSIAYTHGSPALDRSGAPSTSTRRRTESAKGWFEYASQLSHARNFTHADVIEGTHVWVLLASGGVRDIREAEEGEKVIITGQAGGWSMKEDAWVNNRFT